MIPIIVCRVVHGPYHLPAWQQQANTTFLHLSQNVGSEESIPADPVSEIAGSEGDGPPCELAAPAAEDPREPEVQLELFAVSSLAFESSRSPPEPTRVVPLEPWLPPLPPLVLPAGVSGMVILSLFETWCSGFGTAVVWLRLSAPEARLACGLWNWFVLLLEG
jgi:hypothetical protein